MQPSEQNPETKQDREEHRLTHALMWIGVAGLTAGLAFTLVRALAGARRAPDDPTSQRIQQLIDEANSLLKTLDEQRSSA